MKNIIKKTIFGGVWLQLLWSGGSVAMQTMDDSDLADVSGRDGISVTLTSQNVSANSIDWTMDAGTALESRLRMEGISLQSVELDGANVGVGNFNINAQIDAGSDGVTAGLGISTSWDRTRLRINDMRHGTDVTNSVGTWVIDSSGQFNFASRDGLFNTSRDDSALYIAVNDADIYYRQGGDGSPEMVMRNFNFLWDMPAAKVGIDSEGILVEGDANFNITFDFTYDAAPSSPFSNTASDSHGLLFGWAGDLLDTQIRVKSGGLWQETSLTGSVPNQAYDWAAKSEGLNLSMKFNYGPSFRWVIGESDATRVSLEFGGAVKLPASLGRTEYDLEFPLIALDAINAGEGPGGLCWGANWSGPASSCTPKGGQYVDIAPENNALAMVVRDGKLRAYSSTVNLLENGVVYDTFNWALIYTWGDVDMNLYIYPGGESSSRGMKMDVMALMQTYDTFDADGDGNSFEQGIDWGYGSHFMIADTDAGLGIGFLDANFLFAADDLYVSLQSGLQGGVQMSTDLARIAMRGRFAGGDIPNANEQLQIANIDINLEMDDFVFAVYPEEVGGNKYLGFRALMNLANTNVANFSGSIANDVSDDGSYISLAEPSRPETDFRLADMRGTIEMRNGVLDLVEAETPIGRPAELVIATDMLIGRTANAGLGNALIAHRVELGNRNLGTIVVPGGQWHSSLTLSPQY